MSGPVRQIPDAALAELKAYGDQLVSDIETRPLRLATFKR
jgi:hypothetical protein